MKCIKPKSLIKRHCEVCGKPISGKLWAKRAPQNKVLRCLDHLKYPGKWSIEETTLLKQLYPTTSISIIAKTLHRSRDAIQNKVSQLGIKKKRLYHFVVACQICGKDMPSGKKLPSDFFAACEDCVKKQRHPAVLEVVQK